MPPLLELDEAALDACADEAALDACAEDAALEACADEEAVDPTGELAPAPPAPPAPPTLEEKVALTPPPLVQAAIIKPAAIETTNERFPMAAIIPRAA